MVHGLRWSAGVGAALVVRAPSRTGVVESESEGTGDGRRWLGESASGRRVPKGGARSPRGGARGLYPPSFALSFPVLVSYLSFSVNPFR